MGTVRTAFSGSPKRIDPASIPLSKEYSVTLAIYNNLVRIVHKLQPQGELATPWQRSDDLKVRKFKFRQGVKFHHSKVFGDDDVAFTVKWLLDPETVSAARTVLRFVERVDDLTVSCHLDQAYADFTTVLGLGQGRIVPVDRCPNQIKKDPSPCPRRLSEIRRTTPPRRVVSEGHLVDCHILIEYLAGLQCAPVRHGGQFARGFLVA